MSLCDEMRNKISGLADNELNETEKAQLTAHIGECEQCPGHCDFVSAENNKGGKNAFLKNLPAVICFVLLCVITVILTDMQNKKALREAAEAKENSVISRQAENGNMEQAYGK